jgi:hypothetical protein
MRRTARPAAVFARHAEVIWGGMVKLALAVGAQGNVRSETLRAFPEAEGTDMGGDASVLLVWMR